MTNQITDVSNFYSTTLTVGINASTLTFPVDDLGGHTSPCYIVIDPDDPAKREVILCDGSFGGSSFVTSTILNRGLPDGSVAGAQSHVQGAPVTVTPLSYHIDDLNDRVTSHLHTGGTDGAIVSHGDLDDLLVDHHTQYYDAARHTALVHEDLAIDHGSLSGVADDDHTQYLNTARHDVTARHPISVLGTDGLGLGLRARVIITASGSFTKATYPWARFAKVYVTGGGGGGGSAAATGSGQGSFGDGGAGGGTAIKYVALSTFAASETVTIGAGGTAGTSGGTGGDGGNTTFIGMTGFGGQGGGVRPPTNAATISSTTPGQRLGGSATGGDFSLRGGQGGHGMTITPVSAVGVIGGDGGDSFWGHGKAGQTGGTVGPAADTSAYGTGGCGSAQTVSLPAVAGGAGAPGVVVLELYA